MKKGQTSMGGEAERPNLRDLVDLMGACRGAAEAMASMTPWWRPFEKSRHRGATRAYRHAELMARDHLTEELDYFFEREKRILLARERPGADGRQGKGHR